MPTDRSQSELITRIFGGTGPSYDEIVEVTTAGRDRQWKEALLDLLDRPRRVLDLACGTGILTFMLRDRFPEVEVVGVDMTEEYLEVARRRASEREDSRVRFLLSPAEEAPLSGRFDAIVSCYLPKFADLGRLIPRLAERLEGGGLLAMQDFVHPEDPIVARAWRWGFKQQLKWVRRNLPEAVEMFERLPELIRESRWVGEMTELMREHGLREVTRRDLNNGQLAMVWGRKEAKGA